MPKGHGLGLREPRRERVLSFIYPLGLPPNFSIDKILDIPYHYRRHYDQGSEGACVGFGYSWMLSILNRRKYDAFWLYNEAKKIDPWEGEEYSGTSEVAGAKVLIDQGHRRIYYGIRLPALGEGIESVRFIDYRNPINEIRAAIDSGIPVGLAIPWYSAFDNPQWSTGMGWVIGDKPELGSLRGWHFICCYGIKDSIDCIKLTNSWGYDYPLVYMPYRTVERMADMGATFAIVTDR